ncbi:GntR family transcriptional regulator [Roseovarius salis]|uniref:GntR family transcriptional regulator n=1 Tax=Roseovarius salis TaxID=3376063 RepID=UPI0037CC2882
MERRRKSHTDLARRIVETLRVDGAEPGTKVVEQRFADSFGVSRTPIRAALRLLTERGILHYVPRQGYSLARPLDTDPADAPDLPASEEDELFRAILRDRFANRLGDTVSVNDLMRRYDAARPTVMHVLAWMTEDGLLERGHGQQWRFGPAPDSLSAIEESARFRELIEPAALREPGFVPDTALFGDIRRRHMALISDAVAETEMRAWVNAGADFHDAVAACCRNRFLARAIRQQTRLRRLSSYHGGVNRRRLREAFREHLAILDAAEAGDTERAADLMTRHVRAALNQRPRVSNRGVPPIARPVRR